MGVQAKDVSKKSCVERIENEAHSTKLPKETEYGAEFGWDVGSKWIDVVSQHCCHNQCRPKHHVHFSLGDHEFVVHAVFLF